MVTIILTVFCMFGFVKCGLCLFLSFCIVFAMSLSVSFLEKNLISLLYHCLSFGIADQIIMGVVNYIVLRKGVDFNLTSHLKVSVS